MRPLGLLALAALAFTSVARGADAPGTAGFSSKGFSIVDASGKRRVDFGFSFQPRFTTTMDGDPDATDLASMMETGFRIRRMLVLASGKLADPIEFKFRADFAKSLVFTDASGKDQQVAKPLLDDAEVIFKIAEPFQIAVGQWKVPFTASQMGSDSTLLMIDRPITTEGVTFGAVKVNGFSWSRDTGAAVLGTVADKKFEYQAGVWNGDGQNMWPPVDRGMLGVVRVAAAPLGAFPYDDVDLERGEPRLGIGAAASLNSHPVYTAAGKSDGADKEMRAGGELRFAAKGLSFEGEYLLGSITAAAGGDPVHTSGMYAQLGYCLPFGVAPGFRWSTLDPDGSASSDSVTELGGVVNVYLPDPNEAGKTLGHKAQVQVGASSTKLEDADHPLYNQATVALTLGI